MADSEKYFTKMVDGQLSVATVAQSGEIIPEESRPGDVYTTALVQTDDGPQLCVKTYDLNGGGGGGGTVDQTYDPTSTNAQSGTAVAEAVAPALKNLATGSNSINILGGTTLSSTNSVAIGYNAYQRDSSVAVGYNARPSDIYSVAVGSSSAARQKCTVVGNGAETKSGSQESIAIGYFAKTSAIANIQLGQGTNSTANSFQIFNYQMLDGTTGKIPAERLPGRKMYRVSGFSEDNYILLNYIPTGEVSNYEIDVVAQYVRADHTYSGLLGNATGNYNIPQMLVNNSSLTLNFNHPASDGQWASQTPNRSVSDGGIYHAYFAWDAGMLYGGTGFGYSGLDIGGSTTPFSTIYWNSQLAVGVDYASSLSAIGNAWEGWIDLATLKIRVNGDLVFDGSTAKAGTDFTIVGNPTIVEA